MLTFDTSKAAITSLLFGGLLGGNDDQCRRLEWLGQQQHQPAQLPQSLGADLGLTAGGYDQVLSNSITVSQLIQAAINVLDPNGTLAASATIVSLKALKLAAGATRVVLGDLPHAESGDISALAVNLGRAYDLIEGVVQLANKQNGPVATPP